MGWLKRVFQVSRSPAINQLLLVIVVGALIMLLALFYFLRAWETKPLIISHGVTSRDYIYSPYAMTDAYEQCIAESKSQLSDALLRYTMDNLSTVYRLKENEYFIVLKADVGSIQHYESILIYCTIDANKQSVTYYKEVYPGEGGSILSRAIAFFSNL